MKTSTSLAAAVAAGLAGMILGHALWPAVGSKIPTHAAPSPPADARPVGVRSAADTDLRAPNSLSDQNAATITRLRAELQSREQLLGALAAREDSPPTPPASSGMEPPLDAIQIACRTLDVRMFEVPVDARQAEALQTSLKQILTAETLGSSKLQSLECGSVICKLELRAESEADVNASVENLSGQLGKNFPTAAYYRTASGERAIYVGTAAADLGVDPDQEGP